MTKKPIAMMAVLSTAAMMAAVTPAFFTADQAGSVLAASGAGWVEEHNGWRYKDSDGYYLTDTWKKRNDEMYYLDENGEIATDKIIDDEYYVDETGKRVSNQWLSVYNEDEMDSPDAPEFFWYYFGKDGRAIKSKWLKLGEATYYFNDDGQMLTGKQEIDGHTYYFGDENDGVMKTGWIELEDHESDDPDTSSFWYYFDQNGRMIQNQIDRKIDGYYYTFVDGKMQTGWFKLPKEALNAEQSDNSGTASDMQADTAPDTTADAASDTETGVTSDAQVNADDETKEPSIHGYQYYEEDGKRASGWYTITGAEGISEEGETFRFYFRNGKPFAAETGIQVFSIDSKKYAFNTKGEMQTGKQVITLEDGQIANAYFGDDGVIKTGKQTIYNEDSGENEVWFFHTDSAKKGQGYHGIRDNVIYIYGLRQQADSELRYAPAEFDGNLYLVNASGTIQKASASSKSSEKPELGNGFKDFRDANDKVWVVNTNGVIQN